MKRIILCADDYGQDPNVSKAIVDLLSHNRLSAVSCMTNSEFWQSYCNLLIPYKQKVDIGLHLNLTEGKYLTLPGQNMNGLSNYLVKSHLRILNKNIIKNEFNAQIDTFENNIGCLPDFIDGHQHIHHLPIVRDAVFDIYQNRLKK
ncbi:ChbG/HpnK family deacetylase, partial [Gammaproteobacteria bacterium]|nr:ChbG/HpnK family deacetylase [Gammaproteobacteria bacterium]